MRLQALLEHQSWGNWRGAPGPQGQCGRGGNEEHQGGILEDQDLQGLYAVNQAYKERRTKTEGVRKLPISSCALAKPRCLSLLM